MRCKTRWIFSLTPFTAKSIFTSTTRQSSIWLTRLLTQYRVCGVVKVGPVWKVGDFGICISESLFWRGRQEMTGFKMYYSCDRLTTRWSLCVQYLLSCTDPVDGCVNVDFGATRVLLWIGIVRNVCGRSDSRRMRGRIRRRDWWSSGEDLKGSAWEIDAWRLTIPSDIWAGYHILVHLKRYIFSQSSTRREYHQLTVFLPK